MGSYVLWGSRGWRHIEADALRRIDEGVLGAQGDMFVPSSLQQDLYSRGMSVGLPSWENFLNDLVTQFVLTNVASPDIASSCYVLLGQEEGRAMSTMDHALVASQRVREAVLAFNLLATGNPWTPAVGRGFEYRTRDWLSWCDTTVAKMTKSADRLDGSGDRRAARSVRRSIEDLRMVREAFAAAGFRPASSGASGCFIATSVYGDHDAPEVLVLRTWRDEVLSRSVAGRATIRTYYAVSPGLVRVFGDRRWFRHPARQALDRLVGTLAQTSGLPVERDQGTAAEQPRIDISRSAEVKQPGPSECSLSARPSTAGPRGSTSTSRQG